MVTAKDAFEAVMRADGHSDFTTARGKYVNAGLQVRWRWFLTGWEIRGLHLN